jgi:NO-binding membrane sensor protein with MHYT domain
MGMDAYQMAGFTIWQVCVVVLLVLICGWLKRIALALEKDVGGR